MTEHGRSPDGSGSRAPHGAASASPPEASIPNAVADALLAVVSAVRDYLPPDGITQDECLNRVIGATDNPAINPFITELENGCS